MARRTKEDAAVTRERLLDAAERLFRRHGVGHTSLAEVADAAGLTRGAVYWHFKDKSDLFQAMVARAEMPQERNLQEMCAAAGTDPLGALRQATIRALTQFANDRRARDVFEVVFLRCEYTAELAPVQRRQYASRLDCYAQIERAMRLAVRQGQLPPHVSPRLAARGLYAYVGGLIRDFLEAPKEINCARDAPHLVDFFLDGLKHAPRYGRTGQPTIAGRRKPPARTTPARKTPARRRASAVPA